MQIYFTTPPAGVTTASYSVTQPTPQKFACGQKTDINNGRLSIIWCDENDYQDRIVSNFFPGATPTDEEMCGGGTNSYFDGLEVWPNSSDLSAAAFELLCTTVDFLAGTKSGDHVVAPQVNFGPSRSYGNYWFHST